jgi:hypothetical protein
MLLGVSLLLKIASADSCASHHHFILGPAGALSNGILFIEMTCSFSGLLAHTDITKVASSARTDQSDEPDIPSQKGKGVR